MRIWHSSLNLINTTVVQRWEIPQNISRPIISQVIDQFTWFFDQPASQVSITRSLLQEVVFRPPYLGRARADNVETSSMYSFQPIYLLGWRVMTPGGTTLKCFRLINFGWSWSADSASEISRICAMMEPDFLSCCVCCSSHLTVCGSRQITVPTI